MVKKVIMLNQWVGVAVCVCVFEVWHVRIGSGDIHCDSDVSVCVLSLHLFFRLTLPLWHITSCLGWFFAVAFQPLPLLLKSDETYLLNCVCHCEIDFSSLFFFYSIVFFFFPFRVTYTCHWLGLAWLGSGQNVISTDWTDTYTYASKWT